MAAMHGSMARIGQWVLPDSQLKRVTRLLRHCAGQVEDGIRRGLLRNHVGSWQFGEDEEDEDRDGD